MNANQIRMRHYVEQTCRSLAADCEALDRSVEDVLVAGPGPALSEATRLLREIMGLGASVGFGQVSLRAIALQTRLDALCSKKMRSGPEAAEVRESLALLKSTIVQLKPESSRLYDSDLSNPQSTGLRSKTR